ncbi:MAG: gliding motility protein GldN [Bacteroidales bacterium]|nr:gliding motility protein GldN [Bacteroidales bacterium]
MKRILVLLLSGLILMAVQLQQTNAQTVDDEIYTKQNVPNKKPMAYVSLREADVMWSKKLWQMIDCRKNMNQVLYFPKDDMDDRKSLIQLILHGVDNEGLTAYQTDLFKEIMTRDEVYDALGAGEETRDVRQADGTMEETTVQTGVRYEEIKKYMIKEQWYFDRKYSDMRVRIVGICPIREYIDDDTGEKRKSQPFWVYFPEARSLLSNWEVFNRHNDAQRISYDDYFQQRRFNSYVVQESNVYGNRLIDEYTTGINTLLEARKIRMDIFEFEHDLWEY